VPKLINPTDIATPIVDHKGMPTQEEQQLRQDLSELEIIDGEGDPNGQVKAKPKTLYMDTNGSAGSILYIKTTELSEDTGWVLV
jgi:hypothetical protein